MAQADLQRQLTELQAAIQQTAQLVLKLSKTQASDETTGESASDLAADIQDNLHSEKEQLELLRQDAHDLLGLDSQAGRRSDRGSRREHERERERARLDALFSRVDDELKTLRVRYRRAHLQSKQNGERALQLEQESYMDELRAAADAMATTQDGDPPDEYLSHADLRGSLFANRRGAQRSNPTQTKDDLLLSTSSDLTSSLRRTHEMLTSELSRSRFAQETLQMSNAALEELNKRYGTLDDLLSRSKGLLGTLLRSQKSDTWFLETTIYLLMITVGWLVFRRLLYGPFWWLLFLPLKFAYNIIALIVGSRSRTPLAPSQLPSFQNPDLPRIIQASSTRSLVVETMSNAETRAEGDMSEAVSHIIEATQTLPSATDLYPQATEPSAGNDEATEGSEEAGSGTRDEHQQQDQSAQDQQRVRRADGTVLRDRDGAQEPVNPKKRMWEESQPPHQQRKRDEL